MDERIGAGEKNAGHDSHKTIDWQHVWKSVEDAGTQAGNAIKKQVSQIDTKELGDKAKHAAGEGLKVARGKSDSKQANEISDAAARFIPGAGLIRQGAELAHETGADGKVLEGKKGPLHAPSDKTLRSVGKEAIGTVIPIPGGGILSNEIMNRSGVKDKIVDVAVDAAQNHRAASSGTGAEHPRRGETQTTKKGAEYPPKVVIEDTNHGQFLDSAKEKIGNLFRGLHKPDVTEQQKK